MQGKSSTASTPAPMTSDVGEQEAQLREISKTIERLEKAGVSVPDVLRGEKHDWPHLLPFMPTRRRHSLS